MPPLAKGIPVLVGQGFIPADLPLATMGLTPETVSQLDSALNRWITDLEEKQLPIDADEVNKLFERFPGIRLRIEDDYDSGELLEDLKSIRDDLYGLLAHPMNLKFGKHVPVQHLMSPEEIGARLGFSV